MTTALTDPVDRVGRGWTTALSLANVAIWVGWYGPLQILLARQAEDFAPGAGMSKETLLAWVTGVGAVVSLAANPFFGALSDRTTARRGRRSPWIVAGAAGGALSLLVLGGAGGLWVIRKRYSRAVLLRQRRPANGVAREGRRRPG